MTDKREFHTACSELKQDMTDFLDRLVRFESIAGYEGPAMMWLSEQFQGIADISEQALVAETIVNDPEYSPTSHGNPYTGRPNIRVVLKGDGTGKSVIFNTHIDVVPPTKNQKRPFDPYIKDGAMFGRGTCDAKGQAAVLWLLAAAMKRLGIKPKGDVIMHLVIEEEDGGNGTLALVRSGDMADCVINLEPCDNVICTSIRGSIWYRARCYGRAGHAGTADTTVNALMMAMEAIRIIGGYHDDLLAETLHDDPLFAPYNNPMPYNVGELHAGNWPTIAPETAEFSGMFGYLTTDRETVMRELEHRIRTKGPSWLKDHFDIEFPYRHNPCRIDPELPFVKTLRSSYKKAGLPGEIGAVTSSMDAWFYHSLLGIPSLATGCGKLTDAHTINEHIVLDDIVRMAAALGEFVQSWCGARTG